MSRVYYEDIYNLGLLYAYIDSNGTQKMVLLDDLKRFHNTIEKNLEQSNLLLSSNHEALVFLNRLE